jgi:hypothetical protein
MYQQRNSTRKSKFKTRNCSINPVGLLIFMAKILYYGVLVLSPVVLWKLLGLDKAIPQYEVLAYIGAYCIMAQEFIRHPSHFILRGEPWNEKIFINRTPPLG